MSQVFSVCIFQGIGWLIAIVQAVPKKRGVISSPNNVALYTMVTALFRHMRAGAARGPSAAADGCAGAPAGAVVSGGVRRSPR